MSETKNGRLFRQLDPMGCGHILQHASCTAEYIRSQETQHNLNDKAPFGFLTSPHTPLIAHESLPPKPPHSNRIAGPESFSAAWRCHTQDRNHLPHSFPHNTQHKNECLPATAKNVFARRQRASCHCQPHKKKGCKGCALNLREPTRIIKSPKRGKSATAAPHQHHNPRRLHAESTNQHHPVHDGPLLGGNNESPAGDHRSLKRADDGPSPDSSDSAPAAVSRLLEQEEFEDCSLICSEGCPLTEIIAVPGCDPKTHRMCRTCFLDTLDQANAKKTAVVCPFCQVDTRRPPGLGKEKLRAALIPESFPVRNNPAVEGMHNNGKIPFGFLTSPHTPPIAHESLPPKPPHPYRIARPESSFGESFHSFRSGSPSRCYTICRFIQTRSRKKQNHLRPWGGCQKNCFAIVSVLTTLCDARFHGMEYTTTAMPPKHQEQPPLSLCDILIPFHSNNPTKQNLWDWNHFFV